MNTRYVKPTTEVVTLNLRDAVLDEGEMSVSVYDQDGKKSDTQIPSGGTLPGEIPDGAKHYNAWETWD